MGRVTAFALALSFPLAAFADESVLWNVDPSVTVPRRVFSVGASYGGGMYSSGYANPAKPFGVPNLNIGALELRTFLRQTLSLDMTIHLGESLGNLIATHGIGFGFGSDFFLSLNPRLSRGLGLMLGLGPGFQVGNTLPWFQHRGWGAYSKGLGARVIGQLGVEFSVGQAVWVALMARPHVGFESFWLEAYFGEPAHFDAPRLTAGATALISISFNAVAFD